MWLHFLNPPTNLGHIHCKISTMSLVESGPGVFAPLLAGALLPLIGLAGILIVDVATFFLAIGALLVIHIPQPRATQDGQQGRSNLWKEAAYGFIVYLRPPLDRPGHLASIPYPGRNAG